MDQESENTVIRDPILLLISKNQEIIILITNLVVEAWAIIFPPIGLIWGPAKSAEPSTCATTWFVITTATPN